jgi:hypothetical protein
MRGVLSREQRLEIIITKLKTSNQQLRSAVRALRRELKMKDHRIAELEEKLLDKEQQRKLLLSYLYKPAEQGGRPQKPRGKKPGAPAFHRPPPPDSAVTEERTFSLKTCPLCRHAVEPAVDKVVKYEEDIDLAPRTMVRPLRNVCQGARGAPNPTHRPQRAGLPVVRALPPATAD